MVECTLDDQTDQSDGTQKPLIGMEQNQELQLGAKERQAKEHQDNQELDLAMIDQLRELLRAECESNKDLYAQLHYEEIMDESSPQTCWRYLAHCGRNVMAAFDLIKQALVWRKENGVDELRHEDMVKEFWLHAPIVFSGRDKEGHDLLYVVGKHYRKPEAQLKPIIKQFSTNLLFTWDRQHRHDLQQMTIVFDVTDTGFRNMDLDYMAWLVGIRDFLPLRIGQIYVVGIPLLIRPLIRLIISWLPELYRERVLCGTFEELIEPNIDQADLPVEVGGQRPDERYRLAPVEAPWARDSARFSEPTMQQAVHDAIGFSISPERSQSLEAMQVEYERNKIVS